MGRRVGAKRIRSLATWALIALAQGNAEATPWIEKGFIGAPKWGVPITVFISPDPVAEGPRAASVKAAVEAWSKAGKGAGIPEVKTVILKPDGTIPDSGGKKPETSVPGTVLVVWGSTPDGARGYTDRAGGIVGDVVIGKDGNPTDVMKNPRLEGLVVRIDPEIVSNEQTKNVMMHEFGHVLGLDHEAKSGSIMHPFFESYMHSAGPGEAELRELKSLYGATKADVTASVDPSGDGGYRYAYSISWISGAELSLFQLATGPLGMSVVETPPGWTAARSFDGRLLSFRVAPDDSVDPYLGEYNPFGRFILDSPGEPGEGLGWVGEYVSVPIPVPEPESWSMLALGMGLLGFWRRREFPYRRFRPHR